MRRLLLLGLLSLAAHAAASALSIERARCLACHLHWAKAEPLLEEDVRAEASARRNTAKKACHRLCSYRSPELHEVRARRLCTECAFLAARQPAGVRRLPGSRRGAAQRRRCSGDEQSVSAMPSKHSSGRVSFRAICHIFEPIANLHAQCNASVAAFIEKMISQTGFEIIFFN